MAEIDVIKYVEVEVICDRCAGKADETGRSAGVALQSIKAAGWKITRHRGDKGTETVCPECIKKAADAKAEKKAALKDERDRFSLVQQAHKVNLKALRDKYAQPVKPAETEDAPRPTEGDEEDDS